MISALAHSQPFEFNFDAPGNLVAQTAEIITPPRILGHPQPQVVAPGALASFFVVAANTHNLTYQWRFNGTNINGATKDALLLQNVGATNEGQYVVVLLNGSGSVTSAPAALMLDGDLDGLPDSWELASFGNLNQYPTGDSDGDGVSNRDEFLDGTNPASSASVRYRLTVLSNGGSVTVVPARLSYTNGEVVTLTATAISPQTFRGWTGDTNTSSNPLTLVMTTNKTVFARQGSENLVWKAGSGDWHVASNWEPQVVPTTNDNVSIFSGATVTLNSAAECRNLTLGNANSGPTLTGSGTLTLYGNSTWVGGTMSGTGRTIIAAGGTLDLANAVGVNLAIRTLENGGTVIWTSGFISMAAAVITNRAGALFENRGAGTIEWNGGVSRFDNTGILRKTVHTGTMSISSSVLFNNYGAVEIQTGTLRLAGGGTHTGSFTVPAGTTLNLGGGSHNASAASSITGAGNLTISGVANLAGLVNVSGVNLFSGGTANLNGNYICTNNPMTIAGGTANFNGTGPVTPSVVTLSSGELGGSQVVTVLGVMNWTGGVMGGTGRTIIPAGVTLDLANAVGVNLAIRTLENGGTVIWTSGFISMAAAVITNRAGALFENRGAGTIEWNGGVSRFDNTGILRKTVHTGTMNISSIGFNNYGTVEILNGILAANAGYTSTAGARLHCAIGGTIAGTGYGRLQVGTAALNGALSVTLANGFVPATNDSFTVLTGPHSGTFANFYYPSNEVTMQVSNSPSAVIVRVTDVFIVPQPAPVPAGLISWWRAEGNALDNAGTNHGVLTNGATFATGQVGQTFALDGANDYVQVPDSQSLRPASVTLEAWVKFFATNGIRVIIGKPLGNGAFNSYALAFQDGAVLAGVADNSGFGPFLIGPANTVPGQWYHLAYTFDGSSKQQVLYVNGIPVASGTANKTMSYDAQPVLLGADVENGVLSFFHHGQIDEASLYNRALTSDEIATIYNAGAAGKQLPTPQLMLFPPEISGTNFKLTWTAVSNATYRVEFNPNLTPSNWTALPGDVIAVSNTASKLDAMTFSNRLYRVRVLPP